MREKSSYHPLLEVEAAITGIISTHSPITKQRLHRKMEEVRHTSPKTIDLVVARLEWKGVISKRADVFTIQDGPGVKKKMPQEVEEVTVEHINDCIKGMRRWNGIRKAKKIPSYGTLDEAIRLLEAFKVMKKMMST